MDVPVETGEPRVATCLLQFVDEVFPGLLLCHLQHQGISGRREGGGRKEVDNKKMRQEDES